jgi:cytoskeletal protein RodZ
MSSTTSVQRSSAIQNSTAATGNRTPDFRARAMAKQAWLVRRSEPKRGLLLGLIAGGAIGCLGAFAVMSVIPNEGPARATSGAATVVANPPTGVQTATPKTEAAAAKPSEASTPSSSDVRRVAADRSPAAPAAPATSATPRPDAARTELSSNTKVPAVTPAEPPATQSLTSDAPVLAQGGTPEPKPRVAEKKKKKKQVVKRNRPQPNQFARPDNFFFGGDRMARSF